MRSFRSAVLWLLLVPAAFAMNIEDPDTQKMPSIFDLCSDLQPLFAEPQLASLPEIDMTIRDFGSITGGFADFSATDTLLRFLDEFVMASMQSSELRHKMRYLLDSAFDPSDTPFDEFYLVEIEIDGD